MSAFSTYQETPRREPWGEVHHELKTWPEPFKAVWAAGLYLKHLEVTGS
jgi:hypothetical protein